MDHRYKILIDQVALVHDSVRLEELCEKALRFVEIFLVSDNLELLRPKILGVLTRGDLRRIIGHTGWLRASTERSGTICNKDFFYVFPSTSEFQLLSKLQSNRNSIKYIPVLLPDRSLEKVIDMRQKLFANSNITLEPKSNFCGYKVPCRISFVGGGSDKYESFAKNAGATLSCAIDLYSYVLVRKRSDKKVVVKSAISNKIEVFQNSEEIGSSRDHVLLFGALKFLKPDFGLDVIMWSDSRPGSGLGGSSATMVALIQSIAGLTGRILDTKSLKHVAFYIERIVCDLIGGWQDYVPGVYGGAVSTLYTPNEMRVTKSDICMSWMCDTFINNCLLIDLGVERSGAFRADAQIFVPDLNIKEFAALESVELAERAFKEKNIKRIGQLLNDGWQKKRQQDPRYYDDYVDDFYAACLKSGALGGKRLGAPGGGYFLLIVDAESMIEVRSVAVEFNFTATSFSFLETGVTQINA